ncbi:MAG: GMC oxidoreductase [Phycisphaerales bacterium]|nr:GMC oxidoreductase [Phycisphaerales bacterium]
MLIDAGELEDQAVLTAPVVIVGAGPAGIVLALELDQAGIEVLLIESGSLRFSEALQELGDTRPTTPERHPPMSECTRRQVGGASVIWGGRCLPYDPVDFDQRDYMPHSTWPVAYESLVPYFPRVGEYLSCGGPIYDLHQIPGIAQTSIVPGLPDGDILTSTLERWSLPTNFGREYLKALRKSTRIRLVHGLSCTEIESTDTGDRVKSIHGRTLAGHDVHLRGERYVITGGGLNSTRLLLSSDRRHEGGIGNHSGLLGRFYTGHLGGRIARVHFSTPPRDTVYSFDRDQDRVYLRRRLSFSREFLHREQLPNIVSWLVNSRISDPSHGNGIMSFAYLSLSSRLGKHLAPEAIRRAAIKGSQPGATRAHIGNMVRDWWKTLKFIPTFGYKRYIARRKVPGFHLPSRSNIYDLYYWGEQMPNPDSRVSLLDERDDVGMRRLAIDVQYQAGDFEGIVRAHRFWDEYLQRHDCGRLEYFSDDPEADVRSQPGDGFHQIGTTRMAERAEDGVVDPNCRVHGFEDLYVMSSSVFVTAGQANSMVMILSFALRLAEQLKQDR